ncbi:ADP-ribosyl-GH domain-containing protein [Naegleria gruberi]|uniref:ADP-ribosylhydrolase ARH3 n=1 Tax=Naegleria gruberi TaxID=5762 RepID=D2VNE3_NAEGR|nr:ADP-ribosyl-GH domain-containing protein [Naegleria gruberi]EFC41722.1 ADP-ribosyl-GH domain-containing protein [Naegleria gruberi]|eukprot:XP_002674466.1 ADP-ribosyl-GH domain-containing protein [Naegleria gruberi strain NEG-M]
MVSCAVGATIGDAIGSPFENKKPEEIQRIWSKSNNTINDHLCHLGLIYTDDTQMAISIIESYLVLWKFLSSQKWFDWAGFPLADYQFGGFRGTGRNFRGSVAQLNENCTNDISKDTAGNGVAMRVWPCVISVFRYPPHERIGRLREEVIANAKLTHRSVLGIIPAYSIAWLMYQWMSGSLLKLSSLDIISAVLSETSLFEKYLSRNGFKDGELGQYSFIIESILKEIQKRKFNSPDEYMKIVKTKVVEYAPLVTKDNKLNGPSDGFAVASCTTALFHSIIHKDEELLTILKKAIDIGGDTDTVASMVGAMVGAYKGAQGISIPFYITQQVVGYQTLYDFFKLFIEWANGSAVPDAKKIAGFLYRQELKITKELLAVKNEQRTPHYMCSRPVNVLQNIVDQLKKERSMLRNVSDEDFIRNIIPKFSQQMMFFNESDLNHIYNQIFSSSNNVQFFKLGRQLKY